MPPADSLRRERVHRGASRALRGRADLPHPGRVGVRVLRASVRPALAQGAVAESFVDSFKTELIADRTWATRSQLELAVVEYVAWFNNERLHEALEDRPPREVEELYAVKIRPTRETA
jgi:putative transposase